MKLTVKEMVIFAFLGALMLLGDVGMDFLPNVHFVGMLTVAYTVVYRAKALYPIFVYVLLLGLISGFASWWIPYLYIWPTLWGMTMALPRRMPKPVAAILYILVCGIHGLLSFSVLYLPAQVYLFGMPWESAPIWLAQGLVFDIRQTAGNVCFGTLILPFTELLRRAERAAR